MNDAEWSAAALQDLESHFAWLSRFDHETADRITGEITAKTRWLVEHPLTGSPLDIGGMRKSIVARTKYLIIYRLKTGTVEIVRVRHTAENWRLG